MRPWWRKVMSYLREEVVEVGQSTVSPDLQVWYAYGRLMLNTANVNYSFGSLDRVFRSTFGQLNIRARRDQDALLLGLGAGNVVQLLAQEAPALRIVAVEIDPEVIRLGRAHFGLVASPQLEIVAADAIAYVQACDQSFDLVIVDLFVDEEVPEKACSEAYLLQLASLLRPGGLLIFNRLNHTASLSQQTANFGRKMQAVLPSAYALKADQNLVWVYEKK